MSDLAVIPQPGTDLVPDGWCESTVVPWLVEQTSIDVLRTASAQLAGLETAYKTLNADTLELVKARRLLEVRIGDLLGPTTQGTRTDMEPSHASESSIDKDERYRFRKLAENREAVEEIVRTATDADSLSRAAVLSSVNGAHVGANSGDNEWYTPPEYITAARTVMGGIDLDPASNEEANKVVEAKVFFTPETNGLKRPWDGKVWMNPPYARPLIDEFCAKLAESFAEGQVTEACVLVNNATETGWFHALAEVGSGICFPRHRVKFWHPRKTSTPLQGQAVIYLGENIDPFREVFLRFGFTVIL